jgi:hypothetical protein
VVLKAVDILKFVGQKTTNEDLNKWLVASGNEKVILEEGDYRTYVERPEHGYCLTFTDEAMFIGLDEQAIGAGSLYLSGIFFYSEDYDGYKQFKGELPNNVFFNDSTGDLQSKLGVVEWNRYGDNGALISERWDYKQFKFHVTYISEGTIGAIAISQPDKI